MAKIDDAKHDYMNGMKYREIAEKYAVSINTVKSWRSRHGWERDTANAPKKGAPKNSKRGAPKTNKFAVGNDGGAPKGNKNALTTGEYETISFGTLSEHERELFEAVTDDPLITVNTQIRELKIRQYRIMQRIQQRQVQQQGDAEVTRTFEMNGKQADPLGSTIKTGKRMDDLIKLESALDSVNAQLLRAVNQKQHILESLSEEKRKLLNAQIDKAEAEALQLRQQNNDLGMEKQMHEMSLEDVRRLASDNSKSTTD